MRLTDLNLKLKKSFILCLIIFSPLWVLGSLSTTVAFYSGTFDPPTLAHLQIIQCALGDVENNFECQQLGKKIKRVVVSVNKGGAKDTFTSALERVLMLQKALQKYGNKVEIIASSSQERDKKKIELTKNNSELYQMIGEDSFLLLPENAFQGQGLNKKEVLSKYIILPRDTEAILTGDHLKDVEITQKFNQQNEKDKLSVKAMIEAHADSVVLFPKLAQYNHLSSTLARNNIEQGLPLDQVLAPEVIKIIKNSGFYLKLPTELSKLHQSMFIEGFNDFINDIEKGCPNILYLHPDRCTVVLKQIRSKAKITYKEGGSESRWAEKYIEAILNSIIDENEREVFDKNISYMITASFQGKPYGKLPHLTPVSFPFEKVFSSMRKKQNQLAIPSIQPLSSDITDLNCFAEKYFLNKKNYNMDIDRYLYDRFPVSLKEFLLKKRDQKQLSEKSLFISNQALIETLQRSYRYDVNQNQDFDVQTENFYFIQTRRGQPHRKLYLGYNSITKAYRLIATQVTGMDRRANVFCQLKLLGIFDQFQDLSVKPNEFENEFFQLNSTGENLKLNSNDILLFGFKTAWIEEMDVAHWKRTKLINSGDSDLELFENTTSLNKAPRIIFARNVFGDEAKSILSYLYKRGLRKVIYIGTAGAVMNLKIGSIVIPNSFIDQNLKIFPFDQSWALSLSQNFSPEISILSGKKQAWAPHLFDETIHQLIHWRKHGVGSIDIEGYHMAQFREIHPDLKMANFYIISDQTLGTTTIEQSNSQTKLIANTVHYIIKALIPQIFQSFF